MTRMSFGVIAGKAVGAVLRRAQDVIQELASVVRKQDEELSRLRKENVRLEAIRKLVRR